MNLNKISRAALPAASSILLLLAHLLAGAGAGAAWAAESEAIQPAASLPRTAAGPVDAEALVSAFYAAGPPPPWLSPDHARARLALDLISGASAHGLDPAHYRADALERRLAWLRDATPDAAFERDLSTAMLQLLADLHFGRAAPASRAPAGEPARFDPVAHLHQALRDGRLEQAVEAAAPAIPLYRRVKATLAHYRQLSRLHPQWDALPVVSPQARISAGSRYDGVAQLRERLRILGDFDADEPVLSEGVYTDALAAAVRRFQFRHGLAEDGVLGPATLAALAVPPSDRVLQLELTLERLRWLPPPRGRLVAVNLPAYRLWAFDPNAGAEAQPLEMRVIVGTAARTPTPIFIGQMRYLEFNPYWNVPRSIAIGEIVPKLTRNPAYLAQNSMELVSASGQVLPAASGDAIARLRAGTARVRQRPGPRNVLGEVKFAMPNPMNIYLHSTSSKELFDRARCDLSHGCIRVEHPAELAQFVLADSLTWNAGSVAAAMRPGPTRTVTLAEPVTVVLFYATAITDRQGRALFSEDIYRRDQPLIRTLRAR